MATNNTTTTATAATAASTPPEQAPLNTEGDAAKVESGTVSKLKVADTEKVQEITEKLKKPTIGVGLVIFLVLNIIMFFVGITTTKDCPIQPIIPIYLAVAGAIGIVNKIIPIMNRNRRLRILDVITSALVIIDIVWMILGSVWIYSIYKPNYDPSQGLYCNKTAYLLAFWLLTINYVCMFVLLLVLPCCILCGFLCLACLVSCQTREGSGRRHESERWQESDDV